MWAEPFTKLRLQKIFNLLQDPFERADITSNTFWDWQLNHVGQVYGAMDDVGAFVLTFKEFPPRSFPPSFVPTNIMEETLDDIKDKQAKAGERAQEHRQDPLRREPVDRTATAAARRQINGMPPALAGSDAGRRSSLSSGNMKMTIKSTICAVAAIPRATSFAAPSQAKR